MHDTHAHHIRAKHVQTAGGVLVRAAGDAAEILLISHPAVGGGFTYGLPKGHVDAGETVEAAALREVSEETGLAVSALKIVRKLGVVTRLAKDRGGPEVTKDIHLFLMEAPDYTHGPADEEYAWVPLSKAIARMYFPAEATWLQEHRQALTEAAR